MNMVGVRLRTHFSLHHAQAAAFHAQQAAAIQLDGSEEAAIALGAHVAAAVISAGAFLEATANEIAEDDSRARKHVQGQPPSMLKLNEHLAAASKTQIAHDAPVWQSARTLLDLRNRLVHYTHDWLDSGTENMIGDKALTRSDLLPRMEAEFEFLPSPAHYVPWFLSPDCAAWSINTAVAFVDEFFRHLDVVPFHEHLRQRIEVQRPRRIT